MDSKTLVELIKGVYAQSGADPKALKKPLKKARSVIEEASQAITNACDDLDGYNQVNRETVVSMVRRLNDNRTDFLNNRRDVGEKIENLKSLVSSVETISTEDRALPIVPVSPPTNLGSSN